MADVAAGPSARKRTFAVVALWTGVMIAVSFASGCYGHNCEGDFQIFGVNPGEGHMLSADVWESGPMDGVWLPFPKQRAWFFSLPDLGDRNPQIVIPYVSAEEDPNHSPGGNFTIAAGNLAEISGIDKGRVVVHNGTCADYYIRVVVQAAPAGADASADAATDAAATDAGTDAETGP